jgi:glycosyltransferase involved in cell wall biosynthesis
MRYKILYIHNKTGISGGERSLLNLWRHMDREMFELFLILPGEGPFSEKAREYGVNIFYSKAPAFILKNLFRAVKTLFDWSRYVLNNRISLIHSYTPRNNILSGIIGRLFFRPVIWHERNLIYDDKFDVSRRFMFLPNRIICNSYAIAERFKHKDYRPAKVQVVHNGVDLNKYNPSLDAEKSGVFPGSGCKNKTGV